MMYIFLRSTTVFINKQDMMLEPVEDRKDEAIEIIYAGLK